MEQPNTVHGIYVDLDALLDTRMSTLFLVHEDLVGAALNTNYTKRLQDNFEHLHPELDLKKFRALYDGRDNEVLHNAAYTKILLVIREAVQKLFHQKLETPYVTDMFICVNTFPFTLNAAEEEAVAKALLHYTNDAAEIRFIRMDNATLVPTYCLQNFSLMIKYDYEQWFDHHAQTNAIKYCPLATVKFLVPELFFVRLPNKDEWNRMRKGTFDPFKDMKMTWSSIASLNFLPIEDFSIDLDTKWKKLFSKSEEAPAAEQAA